MALISKLKMYIVPKGSKPRRILSGPFKGIQMCLSLEHQSQVLAGLFEREAYPWLERLSDGIVTAIDIGAAHGEYTLFFLLRTAAQKVYAFEPDSAILPVLRHNLELNGAARSERLEVIGKPVNEEMTLDSFAKCIRTPCLIKMDVDGHEAAILNGAKKLNSVPGVRWLIETHSKDLELACIDKLKLVGFKTQVVPNAWWRVILPEQRVSEQNRWLVGWKD